MVTYKSLKIKEGKWVVIYIQNQRWVGQVRKVTKTKLHLMFNTIFPVECWVKGNVPEEIIIIPIKYITAVRLKKHTGITAL